MAHRFRLTTYNVHACLGIDGRRDPVRIAEVIAACKTDIVALQEVDVGRKRSGLIDQAKVIAGHLSMTSHFHPALEIEEEAYGDAVISTLPMRLIKRGSLPAQGEPRGALWVEVTAFSTAVQLFVTHLGLRGRDRMHQIHTLLGPQWMGSPGLNGSPVVLAGDLNAVGRSFVCKALSRRTRDCAAGRPRPTFPSRLPLLRLDHVFASPDLRVLGSTVHTSGLARVASDHLPLSIDFEIDAQHAHGQDIRRS